MTSNTNIQGTCLIMCPSKEIILREREKNLLHPMELRVSATGERTKYANKQRMVKEFSRSAAGTTINPSDVRPAPVLCKTVRYLLSDVIERDNASWDEKYDFISNRLRAIQQDVVVQGIDGDTALSILAPAARFHLFSQYQLCDRPVSQFDPHLNLKQLNQILASLLSIWKDNQYKTDVKNPLEELEDSLKTLSVQEHPHERYVQASSVVEELECMYLLINLGNQEALAHGLEIPSDFKRKPLMKAVLAACLSDFNYHALLKLAPSLPPLLSCALHLHLNKIQRYALKVLSKAHSNPNPYKLDDLQENLLFDSKEDLVEACNHYGITTTEDGVQFSKTSFKNDAPMLPAKKCKWMESKLAREDIPSLLLP